MAFEIGSTAGGYEFIDILGNSKTGVAYKVRNVKFGRLEMLRILPRNVQGDQERVERFLREVKVHARLSHPNIITFYNATEIEGQLVMTMELVEGTPLASRLESGPVPCLEAMSYMRQVLSALGYAHKQSIVHRDVTPANILITPDDRAMLGSFGMAKAPTDPNLTQTGTAVGVAQYMSPEQVKGVTALDPRSDLYSLGVVLYQIITGVVPFDASSHFEIMVAHVNAVPKAPSSIRPEVPAELDRIILTALAKDPAQRFATANDFSEALAGAEQAVKEKSGEKSLPKPVTAPAPKWRAEAPPVPSKPRPAAAPVHVAVRVAEVFPPDRAEGVAVPAMAASARKTPDSKSSQSRRREWTFTEYALTGALTSMILLVVFLIVMTVTGVMPLSASH